MFFLIHSDVETWLLPTDCKHRRQNLKNILFPNPEFPKKSKNDIGVRTGSNSRHLLFVGSYDDLF